MTEPYVFDPTDSDVFRAAIGQYVLDRIDAGGALTFEQLETFKTWFRLGYTYGDSE